MTHSSHTFKTLRISRTQSGALLGCAVFLNSSDIEPYVDKDTVTLEYRLKQTPTGILIEIGEDTL